MSIFSCRATASPIGLGEFGLAGADIAREHHQRRPAQHRRQKPFGAGMMPSRPVRQARRVDQQRQDFGQPALLVVEADKPGEPVLRLEIGIGDAPFEQIVEGRACVLINSS